MSYPRLWLVRCRTHVYGWFNAYVGTHVYGWLDDRTHVYGWLDVVPTFMAG
mgnify:CR=1 FL=1